MRKEYFIDNKRSFLILSSSWNLQKHVNVNEGEQKLKMFFKSLHPNTSAITRSPLDIDMK